MAHRLSIVLIVFLVAGCVDQGANVKAASATPSVVPPDLGTIDVVVTTTELQPVSDVVVELVDTDRFAVTDANGSASFPGLEPATYTLVAAKPGYQALNPQGTLQTVVAGEVHEVKLILDPTVIVSAQDAYQRTFIFRGFISCSVEYVRVATLGNRSQCGNGVEEAGIRVGQDPNDNFSHPWQVENGHIMSIVLEATWAPSFAALGDQLHVAAQDAFTCSARSCNYANVIGSGKGGKSPLHHVIQQGESDVITSALERHPPAGYPKTAWSIMRTYCPPGCALAVTLQQNYELITSAFYGAPAPDDWSAKAS